MPRIIPVLDVFHGLAVHAPLAGVARIIVLYAPCCDGVATQKALASAGSGDAGADPPSSIWPISTRSGDGPPAIELYRKSSMRLAPVTWIDAGVRDEKPVRELLDAGIARVVVGLETLAASDALARLVEVAGASRVAFSLDLREGRPLVDSGAGWGTSDPRQIARRAIEAGFGDIVLDLGRVGTGRGVGTVELLGAMVSDHLQVEWVVGGGVAGREDVEGGANSAGASAVLVGSAIHEGRLNV